MVKNLRLNILDIKLFLIFILLLVFSLTIVKLGGVGVEAQLTQYGNECKINYGTCEDDDVNIQQYLDEGKIVFAGDITSQNLQQSLLATHSDIANNLADLCLNKKFLDEEGKVTVFPVNRTDSPADQYPNNLDSAVYDNDLLADIVPRACENGYELMEFQPHPSLNYRYYSAACCPSGYVAVSQTSGGVQQGKNRTYAAACCLIPNDQSPGNMPNEYIDNASPVCYHRNSALDDRTEVVYSESQKDLEKIITESFVRGLPFGTFTYGSEVSGSENICPDDSVCAIVNPSDNFLGIGVALDDEDLNVIYSDQLKDSSLGEAECVRCYSDEEALAVRGNELLFCSKGSLTYGIPLKNNSITDTIAWLAAQDEDNAEYIENCRAQGGIPTAIGCIDTTPIGIITGLIRISLGVMGGVALVQLILVGINYQRGNEAEIKKAREQLIATLTGLAVLVFSVLILRIIGVNILDILPAGSF